MFKKEKKKRGKSRKRKSNNSKKYNVRDLGPKIQVFLKICKRERGKTFQRKTKRM